MVSHPAGYAPDLEKYLKTLKGQLLDASVETLISLLKRRQIKGSEPCAVATAHILLQVVARSKWHDVDGLIDNVSRIGRRLVEAQPKELVIANIVRRVLGLIRDEAAEDRNEAASETPSEAQIQQQPIKMTLFASISSISNPMASSKSRVASSGSSSMMGSNSIACGGGCGSGNGGAGGLLGLSLNIDIDVNLSLSGGSHGGRGGRGGRGACGCN